MSVTTTKQVLRMGVDGMDCSACEQLLVEHVQRIGGVAASFADAEKGTLALVAESDTPMDEIVAAIVAAGFVPAVGVGACSASAPPRRRPRPRPPRDSPRRHPPTAASPCVRSACTAWPARSWSY